MLNVAVGNHQNGTGQWEWNTPWQSEINGIETKAEELSDDGKTIRLPTGSLTGIKRIVKSAPVKDERLWELFVENRAGLEKWDLVTGDGIPEGTKIFGFSSTTNKVKLITPGYYDDVTVAYDSEIVFKKDIRRGDLVVGEGIEPFTRVSWIDGDSITLDLDKAANISPGTDIKFKRFAAHLPTDGSADMVVRSFAHYTRPAVEIDPLPLTVVIRHGHDWNEDSPNDYGERASEWAKTLEVGDITSLWLYDGSTIDPISDGSTLGLPKEIIKNGDNGNFRLNNQGSAEANSFANVIPELVDNLNGLPVSRIMVDSYARDGATGTSNPLDTVLPFILDTQTPTTTHLDIDLVVRANNTQDADAWNHENVKGRLKPLSGEGSVLIASTAQGIWAKGDNRENPPNILDMLNSLYGLDDKKVLESGTEVEYLESKNWLKNHNDVKFDEVRQADKGTQIYVYGELDGDLSNGFEVEVYNQRVLNTFELGF